MNHPLHTAAAAEALWWAPLGILILDRDGRIAWLNPALEKLLGIPPQQALLGQNAESAEAAWRGPLFTPAETEHLPPTANLSARWLQTWRTPLSHEGKPDGAVHYYVDVTAFHEALEERDRLNKELAEHTLRDPVTGLPNRLALLQGLEPLISRSRRYQNALSVIRLRIDNLADLDTAHGAGSGDAALLAIAHMLKDQLRWADMVGRFDNDEFLLVLPETGLEAASYLREKLRERLKQITIGKTGTPIIAIAQFGIAGWQTGDDRAKMLRRAREELEQS